MITSLFDLMGRTILLGLSNLKFLSREKNYGAMLMEQLLHLTPKKRSNLRNGRWRMLKLCLGYWGVWNPPWFSISGLTRLLKICGVTWRKFTTKATQPDAQTFSIRAWVGATYSREHDKLRVLFFFWEFMGWIHRYCVWECVSWRTGCCPKCT